MKKFIIIGPKVKDPAALQALSVALAKLSTDNKYMLMLEKHDMLNPLTEQLFILMEICKVRTPYVQGIPYVITALHRDVPWRLVVLPCDIVLLLLV